MRSRRSQGRRSELHRLHLYLALRQKTCTLGTAGQFLEVASHVFPDHAFRHRSPRPIAPRMRARGRRPAADDIRLLGRILGDTVRDQEGADVFDLVERIRQTSIRFHRDDDKPARRELEAILDSMSTSQTVRIVRAFSYFSHLANIAEDQNNIRQMRARSAAGGAPRPGTLAADAGACAQAAGFSAADLRKFFAEALVSPVLTAHPTEVRRKSTIDREMEIAALLDRRERVQLTPEEIEASDEQLRRAVLTLWQTNLLRRTKLTVLDEVANGLSFYDYTFLHEVPRLHCALEDRLNEGDGGAHGELASFLRMGSWIGGDRDGNPFVTADVMRGTLQLQSSRVLRFYLEELHVLGAELSLAAHLADVSEGSARARRALARHLAASQRRAVSAGGVRHLCAADRDRAEARRRNHAAAGRRGRALRQRRGVQGRSRYSLSLADLEQFRRDRARPAAAVAPRGGLLRLPSRQPRHPAELRRARAHGRRTDRRRDARHVLSGAERGGADRAAGQRTAQRAAADLALREIQRGDARRTRGVPRRRRGACQIRRRRRSPNASSRCARACPTCWRSRCC